MSFSFQWLVTNQLNAVFAIESAQISEKTTIKLITGWIVEPGNVGQPDSTQDLGLNVANLPPFVEGVGVCTSSLYKEQDFQFNYAGSKLPHYNFTIKAGLI